jgi:putative ABC transport system permease protein
VALINQTAAGRLFGGRSPLGAEIRFWGASRRIVGVVSDEHLHGVAEPAPTAIYVPLWQAPSANGAGVLLVRGDGAPETMLAGARAAIREIDPGLAVFGLEPLEDTVSRSLSEQRFAMLLLGLFAAMALALAAIGVHGVLSYSVTERTPEIGIRIALGAEPRGVRSLVVHEGLAMAAAGILLGLAGAAALTRALQTLLFGVTATDPLIFAGVAAVLAVVAVIASVVPAWRATRIDPIAAIRTEG